PLVRLITSRFVRVLDPREHDDLTGLCLHGAFEIRDLAVGDLVTPSLDQAQRTVLLEVRERFERHVPIGLLLLGGDRENESVDICHERLLSADWPLTRHLVDRAARSSTVGRFRSAAPSVARTAP